MTLPGSFTIAPPPRPRGLAEPLRLLAEVGARDAIAGHAGQFYTDLPDSLGLTLAVGQLPRGAAGRSSPPVMHPG